jgi:predicted nucleotidyltransferase
MRIKPPAILPLFRSEMQVRLLALLLLQPERSWTLQDLAVVLEAPLSSVHRELLRAKDSGLVTRNAGARPHRFQAAGEDSLYEPLAALLRRSVGVEEQLRDVLEGPEIFVAVIHGSWAGGSRRPDSDIDVLVIGDVDLRELRRRVRPVGKAVGREIDLTVLGVDEFRRLCADNSSLVHRVLDAPTVPLVGNLSSLALR